MKTVPSTSTRHCDQWIPIIAFAFFAMIVPCLMRLFRRTGEDYLTLGIVVWLAILFLLQCWHEESRGKIFAFSIVDVLLLVLLLYTCINGNTYAPIRTPQRCWKWIAAGLAFLLGKGMSGKSGVLPLIFGGTALVQAIVVLLQQVEILQSQSFFFPVSGTFGNPQYPAIIICVGFVVLLDGEVRYFKEYGRIHQLVNSLIFTLFFLALICCGSRICFFALLVVGAQFIWRIRPKIETAVVLVVLVVVGLVAMYFIRPESAQARFLIWRAGFPMFLDHPLFGNGPGSFAGEYMYAQARYFAAHPDSLLAIWATNHSQPYNELLRLLCEQGVFGTMLFAVTFAKLLRSSEIAVIPLIAICIIGLAFNVSDLFILYLLFWFLAGFSNVKRTASGLFVRYATSMAIVLSLCLIGLSVGRMCSPAYMNDPSHHANYPTYEAICEKGMTLLEREDVSGAQDLFHLAWQMIPCRITAPYLLFKSYAQTDVRKAEEMAEYILNEQKLQYVTGKVLEMKAEVRQWVVSGSNRQ